MKLVSKIIKMNIAIIQPVVPVYREDFYRELQKYANVDVYVFKDPKLVIKEQTKISSFQVKHISNRQVKGFVFYNPLPLLNKKYDVIISNPPYISYDEEIMEIVKNNEPHTALYADNDGLYYYEEILKNVKRKISISNFVEEEKMMNKKKFMVIALSALMAVSVIGCGTKSEDQASESTAQSEQKTYDVAKYVTLPAYKNMDVTVSGTYEVTEDDVRDYVNNMCSYYPEYEDTDKTVVENGDCVDIDYEGKKDGVAFDGGTAQGYVLEIGSGTFIDGFEDGLIGVKVGETVDLNLTFPENYQSKELAGADVVFTVTVNKIVKKTETSYEDLTDEYVASNLNY